MNIYEIINEATPVDPAVRKAKLARAQASRVAAPTTASTPAQVAAASRGVAGTKVQDLVQKVILRDKIGGTMLTTKMSQALGGYLRIIKYFNFLQIAEQLWQQKIAIETLVTEKQITKADGDAAYRQQVEKMVVAIMATGGFASLIRGLKYIPLLKWFVRGAAAVATGASFGVLGGPSVMIALASEAGAIWFQNFLESPDGQKALAYWVTYFIDPSVTWLWNAGPGKIFGEWATISDEGGKKVDAATQAVSDKRAGLPPAPAAPSTPPGKSGQAAQPVKATPDQQTTAPKAGWAPADKYGDIGPTRNVSIY